MARESHVATARASVVPRAALLAWSLVLATVLGIERLAPPPAPAFALFDQPFYLGIADDLIRTHRFTDGFAFAPGPDAGARPSGMRFGPLVPALFAGAALLDPAFRADLDCLAASNGRPPCGHRARLARAAQAGLVALSLGLVRPIALACGLDAAGAMAALLLALPTAPMLLAASAFLMTETVALALTTLFALHLARALQSGPAATDARRGRNALAAGLCLGLAALARPEFEILVPFACGIAALAAPATRRRHRAARAACLASGAAIPILAWTARNAIVLGHAQLSLGYAGHTLAQRLSFDRMDGGDLAMSFVCWLPDGTGLGTLLAGRGACDRFGWNDPRGFYLVGMLRLVPETLARAGGPGRHLDWLVRNELIPGLPWHLATSVALAWRGLWIDRVWGLALAPILLWLSVSDACRRTPRSGPFLAVAWTALFMLAVHAFVSVDQPRYNRMLIPPLAIAGGRVLVRGRSRSGLCPEPHQDPGGPGPAV